MSLSTTHSGIEITYDEQDSEFHFELRGRSRHAPTLRAAKEAIDKEPAEKRKQTFTRFEAYTPEYYKGWSIVTVTSIAESTRYGGQEYWTVNADGDRRKHSGSSLYPVNEHNRVLVKEFNRLRAEKLALEASQKAVVEQMVKVAIPEELK